MPDDWDDTDLKEETGEGRKETGTSTAVEIGSPGCGWILVTLIVCITIYNIAELYFAHKH